MDKDSENPAAYDTSCNPPQYTQYAYQSQPPGYAYVAQQPVAAPRGYGSTIPYQSQICTESFPDDHCTFSVLNAVFCSFWVGVFALIQSQAVRDATREGNLQAATEHSRRALKLNKIALGFGVATYIVCIILVVLFTSA